uniref:Uncharacterized protein n=1 Tax=Pyramimonas obovata TaxID=1411642 RepID=A0A7S0RP32_9CHLO
MSYIFSVILLLVLSRACVLQAKSSDHNFRRGLLQMEPDVPPMPRAPPKPEAPPTPDHAEDDDISQKMNSLLKPGATGTAGTDNLQPLIKRPATGYTGSAFANGLASRTLQRRQEELEHEKQAMVATYAAAKIKSSEQMLKNSEQRLALAQFEMQKNAKLAEQERVVAVNLAAEEARRKTAAQAYAMHHQKEQNLIQEHEKYKSSVPKEIFKAVKAEKRKLDEKVEQKAVRNMLKHEQKKKVEAKVEKKAQELQDHHERAVDEHVKLAVDEALLMYKMQQAKQGSSALHIHDPHAVVKDVYKMATEQAAVAKSEYDPGKCMQARKRETTNRNVCNQVKHVYDSCVQATMATYEEGSNGSSELAKEAQCTPQKVAMEAACAAKHAMEMYCNMPDIVKQLGPVSQASRPLECQKAEATADASRAVCKVARDALMQCTALHIKEKDPAQRERNCAIHREKERQECQLVFAAHVACASGATNDPNLLSDNPSSDTRSMTSVAHHHRPKHIHGKHVRKKHSSRG